MNTIENKIIFAWWNTSLSNKRECSLNDEEKRVVWETINYFINDLNIDFMAFSEVSKQSINEMKEHCDLQGYDVVPALDSFGKARYDLCFIYKKRAFDNIKVEYLVKSIDTNNYKAGVLFNLWHKDSGDVFHVIASHWSSRLYGGEDARHYSSQKLRSKIDAIKLHYEKIGASKPPYIILMGDYNDEPFDTNLTLSLMGSRDKNIVKKKPSLLYNPFWKELGSNPDSPHIGSYYDKRGKHNTHWNTFDQMLYSHAFLKRGDWTIIEPLCRIIVPSASLYSLITSGKSRLDHLPITGAIQKEKQP